MTGPIPPTLALTFATPMLLIGLAAAAIPVVLHLLASVRAPQMLFPTVRFLHLAMQRTARRRRVEHWLLLLLRSLALGLMALAVAEPISDVFSTGGSDRAMVIVIDNSLSMQAETDGQTRLTRALVAAEQLLSSEDRPATAALLATNGLDDPNALSADLAALRRSVAAVTIVADRAPLAERVARGLAMLREAPAGRRMLCVISDLQRNTLADLVRRTGLPEDADTAIIFIDVGSPARNLAVTDLTVQGRSVVGGLLDVEAHLTNYMDQPLAVDLFFSSDRDPTLRLIGRRIPPATDDPGATVVRFERAPTEPGALAGAVRIGYPDDLPADNARYLCVNVTDESRALVIGSSESTAFLRVALDPFGTEGVSAVDVSAVRAADFSAADLADVDAAFFCNVATFTGAQAQALADFVRQGGSVVFFLGSAVAIDNYHQRFLAELTNEGGFLPTRIGPAVGQVGPDLPATSTTWVDTDHPYLAGLYDDPADYPPILVQRRFRLQQPHTGGRTLIQLADGLPLAAAKPFGTGRVVLWAIPADAAWSNLPAADLFLPFVNQVCLLRGRPPAQAHTTTGNQPVMIRPALPDGAPPADLVLRVTPPQAGPDGAVDLPFTTDRGAPEVTFDATDAPGIYRWRVVGPPAVGALPSGAFAVNAPAAESDLRAIGHDELRSALRRRGYRRLAFGHTPGQALADLRTAARGRNFWDILAGVVLAAVVIEAMLANLSRRRPPGKADAIGEASGYNAPHGTASNGTYGFVGPPGPS